MARSGLWDAITGEHKATFTAHTDIISVVYSPDGNGDRYQKYRRHSITLGNQTDLGRGIDVKSSFYGKPEK